MTAKELIAARPFEGHPPWKLIQTKQTAPFRPNRVFADQDSGTVVLTCLKSRAGEDYAISADAVAFFPERLADKSSWVESVHVMLLDGTFEEADDIDVVEVLSIAEATERLRGASPLKGKGGFGEYFWIRPKTEDDTLPM
jgi:hypothetical protein